MKRKPEWLRKKMPDKKSLDRMQAMVKDLSLHTVCQEANCPNVGECFENRTATFMIMGDVCTRGCRFCAVGKGEVPVLDQEEPRHVAEAVRELQLKHAVITSVTRDDLSDGGAAHFAKTIKTVRKMNPGTSIEVLIPDLKGDEAALDTILEEKPEILNHNIETVPSLYEKVRPGADFQRSVQLLKRVKEKDTSILSKTGIMVGLGETPEEMEEVMEILAEINCDILTIGQYLQPSSEHLPVEEFVTPEQFELYREQGLKKGISFVESGPFIRSSYNAARAMEVLSKKSR
ncbi:MAG: lipoyl synthase [Tindallia sp. MSAO_Bac2]|nr:MAG: lipoyl synthase [Tindallia sp. MSAO_Bac2]